MLIKEAHAVTGGLSSPSKMPGRAYSLPAKACNVGQKMAKVTGSICSGCYADGRGNYRFGNVIRALENRLETLHEPKWVAAMVRLINKQSPDVFRWHDSGDVQSPAHLANIFEVCRLTPDTKHWLPSREYKLLRDFADAVPDNLTIRVSGAMVDLAAPAIGFPVGSVHKDLSNPKVLAMLRDAHICPAPKQDGKCGDCRACWDKEISHVSYHIH